ncbi:collagen-like triple helix repeat-containing protein [Costertonia aggregata]|uniref:Collagen-like protein n=1 Tax=Costertonia aggregata TaxID=343403 RepID=A0A7H9ANA2_9FLAO|nr:collagen-like protein [Costertonia aggregata]QLG44931.1 collagen-like protein [Costertonia aggregata]
MKITTYSIVFVLGAALFLSSCSAEDGEDGAMGPQGIQGEQGPAGQDGADGQDGVDGTPTIISSDWFDSVFSSDAFSSTFDVPDDRISDEVMNSGYVLVYGQLNINRAIVPLPYTLGNQTYSFQLEPENTNFRGIRLSASTDGQNRENFNYFDRFRYVIFPPNTGTSKTTAKNSIQFLKNSGVDIFDYEQLADYLGIED